MLQLGMLDAAVLTQQFLRQKRDRIQAAIVSSDRVIGELWEEQARSSSQSKRLDRFDLELEFSSELGLKMFSMGAQKSVELIWERDLNQDQNKESLLSHGQIAMTLGSDVDDNYQKMRRQMMPMLDDIQFSRMRKKKILSALYRDASKLTRYVQALASAPVVYGWELTRIFKIYQFSVEGDLLGTGVDADKRIRFRFYLPRVLTPRGDRKERRIHRRLKRFIRRRVEEYRLADMPFNRYQLNRIWTTSSLSADLDLGILGLGATKGFLIELRHRPEHETAAPVWSADPNEMNVMRGFVNIAESLRERHHPSFPLSQVRIDAGVSASASLLIGEVGASKSVEYHYRRVRGIP